MQLYQRTAHELHNLLLNKEISAEELNLAIFDRIESVEDKIAAYITLTREKALEQARAVDQQIKNGERIPPLAGIPVAVKDNICTDGILTTAASRMLAGFVPPYSATVVKRLEAAGATLPGKTNLDEFAMGSSTENSAFFPTRNPWDTGRVPGGSSGGSAAAVACGEAICALGSDTGGSIRLPASFCGVVGFKPTYGAVSRYGLIAFASSLDQIGPFSRDVTDCALLLNIICGHDPLDSTSARFDVPDFTRFLVNDIRGMRIGVPEEYMAEGINPGVREVVEKAIALLESLGAFVEYTTLPHTEYALSTYYLIAPAEASSNLARYDGVRYGFRARETSDVMDMFMKTRSQGFGAEVKRRIMLGTYALSAGYYDAYYLKALKVRTLIKEDFDRAFEKYDLLVSPVSPTPAFRCGEKTEDPLEMYMSDICTISVNLAGIPGMSIPCGFVEGMPVGLQLMGRHFDEGTLLRAAYTFEQNTDYHRAFPAL
ncbi:MAG TPA: Asp-tRNA(Asn)/Glu-tRNA(Gln) amidotransferase subunit GatA [Bacillota bacterium]|nr:Asp-tRNA(Asn)/Glu-tRNA(Gln) amidotransferase subunit GatA [Peptococcaceae bacterium MAG4]NLW39023.1 Asp-tRNA(Asn)/Glu-tRNA(Gln) amidotransferase subunit GatA [Peptococcaceae bacterium]HPZ43899.1 Asp-tRNA(Asn)/Glu-tRNA(Gln) amidotransferase subunit GatA [Bacillota bacterium]HQD76254.1 Asp-tRNA(Asn)/Glu-tRNA(Gln) amidotransferase subunit GatA [Bacillota bacterium]HUM59076.1 Asp-tRNA(Asn)/Glu-tRNA(Gln) amidotransferase subunit GatA [Bacillota bacterium]